MPVTVQALSANSGIGRYSEDMAQGRPATRHRNAFGQRLYELREAAGLTQADVANALGLSQQSYSDLERAPVTLHLERLQRLAEILGTSVSELCGERPPRRVSGAPGGRLGQSVEKISQLPRRQQAKILDVVDALLAQHGVDSSS